VTRVAAAFVGCKVSQADGEQALAELDAAGLEPVRRHEDADLVVVHTCCVTAEAERKSRRLVRRLAGGGRRVVVAGCAASLHPGQFDGDGVEVLDGREWATLAAATPGSAATGAARPVATSAPASAGSPPVAKWAPQSVFAPAATRDARTRLVLKVQDGCAGGCTYCVVRLVRGRPRSRAFEDTLAAARAGIAGGCGEVVLSGIDLGAWRDGEHGLPELVTALAGLPGLARLRLSSLEPRHVTPRLLAALDHPRVARHLHVPLQSADDRVLAAMGRPYTLAGYLDAVARARDRLGDLMLSTDVIAGFPAEDEAAHARTLALLESRVFGRVHVFAFSPRPGTAAAALAPLPVAIVRARRERLSAAAAAAAETWRRAALGREAEVLVEERRDGLWRGYSSEYVRYYLRGPARRGALVAAVATGLHLDGVRGRVEEGGTA